MDVADDLMKLMGWLSVDPIDHSLRTGLTEPYTRETLRQRADLDHGFSALVQKAIAEQERQQLWVPPVNATGREVKVTRAAPTAPGSTRPAINWSAWDPNNHTWTNIPGPGHWTTVSSMLYDQARQSIFRMFRDEGMKITAAAEDDDEEIEDGFTSTGARDDLATHVAHYGLKPGTPEFHQHAQDWIESEKYDRYRSGAFDHAARVAVRDAGLARYAQSEADALIEDMLEL